MECCNDEWPGTAHTKNCVGSRRALLWTWCVGVSCLGSDQKLDNFSCAPKKTWLIPDSLPSLGLEEQSTVRGSIWETKAKDWSLKRERGSQGTDLWEIQSTELDADISRWFLSDFWKKGEKKLVKSDHQEMKQHMRLPGVVAEEWIPHDIECPQNLSSLHLGWPQII